MKTIVFAALAAALAATAAVAEPSSEDWMRRESIMNHAPVERATDRQGDHSIELGDSVRGAGTVGALQSRTRGLGGQQH